MIARLTEFESDTRSRMDRALSRLRRRGVSLRRVCREAGVSRRHLLLFLSGDRSPTLAWCERMFGTLHRLDEETPTLKEQRVNACGGTGIEEG